VIGLLGGTFDPVHNGHLDVARAAIHALHLEKVLLIPSRTPPHRHAPQAKGPDRLAMVRAAIADEPRLEASTIELDAAGPSYTSATLDRFAAAGIDTQTLCFIVGADAFAEIPTWHSYPELLDRCHFAAVSRPGLPAEQLRARLPRLASRMISVTANQRYATPSHASIFLIDAHTAPVSSTDVRAYIARGASVKGLVPDAVAAYIDAHRLYPTEAHGH
jgi:nicotinate-nucleotide adenylyltransferase